MRLKPESTLMSLLRRLRLHSLAWSLRRLHVPVPESALVLEVGSGGNPYFRSNVLIDAYVETRERHFAPLIADRPTVLGYVENLPFRDKSFDFVIASHVLEHSPNPGRFLGELQRVARAGYIEVPDALMERLNPYLDHRLEITVRQNRLVIRKKSGWRVDPELVELYEDRVNRIITGITIPRHPFDFHVRYYWQDTIDCDIINREVDATWPAPTSNRDLPPAPSTRAWLKGVILALIRRFLSQNRRNRNLDVEQLLRCPTCHGEKVSVRSDAMRCNLCGSTYPRIDGLLHLFSSAE